MATKLDHVYFSKVPHRSFEGDNCSIFFIPDRRKGFCFGPQGQKYTLSASQRAQLNPVEFLTHNAANKDKIKQRMVDQPLELMEFPANMKRGGFGAGLLIKKGAGAILQPDDVLSVVVQENMVDKLREAIDKHNTNLMAKTNNEINDNEYSVSASP